MQKNNFHICALVFLIGFFSIIKIYANNNFENIDTVENIVNNTIEEKEEDTISFSISANAPTEIKNNSQDSISISEKQIQQSHSSSLAEVLRKNANLSIKQYGAYGSAFSVYLRNFAGSTVAILVDGIQVNSSQTGEFDLTRINVDDIEKIEIVRGASDNKYTVSGAAGGIINIITKKNADTEKKIIFDLDFSNLCYFGSNILDTQNIFASIKKNTNIANWKISSSFVSAKNNFLYYDYNNEKTVRKNNEAKTVTLNASSIFKLSKDIKLTFNENFFLGNIETPGTYSATIYGIQKNIFNALSFHLDIPFLFNGLAEMQSQVSYKFDQTNYNEDTMENLSNGEISLHNLHTASFVNRSTFYFNDIFSLTPSFDFSTDILDSTNCSINDTIITKINFGIGASSEINLNKIKLFPSLKFLFTKNLFMPIPKLGFTYELEKSKTKQIIISANIYRMFTFPTLNQLYWKYSEYATGNPNLENEDGFGGDIIFDYIKKTFSFNGSIFAMHYKNKIQWQNHLGKWKPENLGRANYFGGNISINTNIFSWLEINAKYDLNLSFLLTDNLTMHDNIRIMYTPVNIISCDAIIKYKNFKSIISYNFTGKRYISNLNITYLKPYSLFDFSFEYNLQSKFTFYFVLKNLLNEKYFEVEDYPMPNTSLKIGAKLKL